MVNKKVISKAQWAMLVDIDRKLQGAAQLVHSSYCKDLNILDEKMKEKIDKLFAQYRKYLFSHTLN